MIKRLMVLAACLLAFTQIASADEKTKGKISIWLGYPETLDAFKMGQVEFKKKYPNVDVEILTFELREFEAKLAVSVPAGSGPDILALHDFIFPRYFEAGALDDVPADLAKAVNTRTSSIRRSRISSRAMASRGACRGGRAVMGCSTISIICARPASASRRRPMTKCGNMPRNSRRKGRTGN